MNETVKAEKEASLTRKSIDIAVRLFALAVLIGWCYQILRPFISPVVWGIIIAVAVYPLFHRLSQKLGGRRKLTALIMALATLVIIGLPSVYLTVSSVDSIQTLNAKLKQGSFKLPPPPEDVGSWPVIGKPLGKLWQAASDNLESVVSRYETQVIATAKWLLKTIFDAAVGLVAFAVAIVIAGILLTTAASSGPMVDQLFVRLAGERGETLAEISKVTVRNVVKGILGVSILQSLLAGVAFAIAGLPFAGLWAFLCLILAIIQIGIGPVIIPVIIYAFAKMSTLTAVLLTAWLIFAALADGPVKAMLMGRGAQVPMLVIFLGAIGGFMAVGFLGLFIGAVILSVGYRLFEAWMKEETI